MLKLAQRSPLIMNRIPFHLSCSRAFSQGRANINHVPQPQGEEELVARRNPLSEQIILNKDELNEIMKT